MEKRLRRKYWKAPVVAATAAIAMASLAGCGGHSESGVRDEGSALPRISVVATKASGEPIASRIQVTGVVRASERASIAPKVMGVISEFPIALGQKVEEGDLLVRIDAAEIKAKVLQAEAQLRQAERDLEREGSLLEKGASTSETVKNLSDRVAIMKAMVDEAQVMRGYTEIRAPFDGAVARKHADIGSLASPGMPLLELVGSGGYEVEAGVPESLANDLSIGARFLGVLPSTGQAFEAVLTELSSGAESSSRTVTAKFSLSKGVVARPGQFAKMSLSGGIRDVVTVPEAALSRVGQMERIFVVEDGVAKMRIVKSGATADGSVEILSGVDAGEVVVVEADGKLVDGQPVEARGGLDD